MNVSNSQVYGPAPPDYKETVKIVKSVRKDGDGVNTTSPDGGGAGRKPWFSLMVMGLLAGAVITAGGIVSGLLMHRKYINQIRTVGSTSNSEVRIMIDGHGSISVQDLENATNNFSDDNILGSGGFGTVYRGELHDGTNIAIKRMESGLINPIRLQQLKSEIAVLTKVRHRHLVKLLGFSLDGNHKLIVLEYMPQGTLGRFLFKWEQEGLKPLEWKQRLIIALDVARGVEYLHGLAHNSFIHRDLKPSNILLGDDMRAKVADFGLVRPAPSGECSYASRVAGTFGYFAPEYAGMGQVTTKIDVYSFGVILMELITGQRAVVTTHEGKETLVEWFRRMHKDKGTYKNAIDPTLDLDEEALAGVFTVAKLADDCCASEAQHRPSMSHVVSVLLSLANPWIRSDPDPVSESNEIYLDGQDQAKLLNLALLGLSSESHLSHVVDVSSSLAEPLQPSEGDPPDETQEIESDKESLARKAKPFGWKRSEHDPDDDTNTDGSYKTVKSEGTIDHI
ncbi:hypothetical protein M8C21_006315 [Ambrosia artemisiifolia]|uniref:Protein kinase domain-containing protein n=1 Tax=Ambrosia artemisiifolia TaxID=4212 RepID=A0AAD5GMZ1_AMBAR|nr:hypothetical protein M8C21_006315 [Ambrosia artemisiifolia]